MRVVAATTRFGIPAFFRWYLAVFSVTWVALAVWMVYLSCTNGAWFMVPVLLGVGAVAPLLARRMWRIGVELTNGAVVMTPRIGRAIVIAKRDVASFIPGERSAFEPGASWPLAVRLHNGTLTNLRWAGGWIPGKRGKAQLDRVLEASNEWLRSDGPA